MSEFVYINPAQINPKTKENIREGEIKKLEAYKAEGKKIIGLEMTVPALATMCDKNIDPQHTDGKVDQSCAREVAENAEALLSAYKGKDVVFVTNRVDVDSVASFVLADRFLKGQDITYNTNVDSINKHDTFQSAKWSGPKPIEKAFDPESKTGALASSIKVFMVTPKNIEDVANFIDTGKVDPGIMETYRTVQQKVIDAVKTGAIEVSVKGDIAHVKTTLPCATNVGYAYAPIVMAENPAMKLGPQGEPFRKISICQHEEGYVDLNRVKEELNAIEAGFGGSSTFIGSKQGESSEISIEDAQKIVSANLTPEYKRELAAKAVQNSKINGLDR